VRQLVKSSKIALDRERALRYDFNAHAAFEEATGVCLLEAVSPLFEGVDGETPKPLAAMKRFRLRLFRALLWSGLIHEDPTLTERQVGAWVGLQDLGRLLPIVLDAVTGTLPEPDAAGPASPADPPPPSPA